MIVVDGEMQCQLCARVHQKKWVHLGSHAFAFEPDKPVVPGHLIVAPTMHVRDAMANPTTTAQVFHYAAILAAQQHMEAANFITSIGRAADAAFPHLHVHIIPRTEGDGLCLPWTPKPKQTSTARKSSAGPM